MACYHPMQGYRSRQPGENGKRGITFALREGFHDLPVSVPCGGCIGCRLQRQEMWAVRCMHEASLWRDNAFLTLTLDDEHLPENGSLDKTLFPKFIRALRKKYGPGARYYHSGEYGEDYGRPHYHALLFNHRFNDMRSAGMRDGHRTWRSADLDALWGQGLTEIGSVTHKSASYVAKYIVDKVTGPIAEKWYDGLEPEYSTMSRRPGIGQKWFEKWGKEVFPSDEVIVEGRQVRPPKYYDRLHESADPDAHETIRHKRRIKMDARERTPERLRVREECTIARVNLRKRARL